MELCAISLRMTVTVTNRGMNENGLVRVKRGCCCRERNRVNTGGGKIVGEEMIGCFDGCHQGPTTLGYGKFASLPGRWN